MSNVNVALVTDYDAGMDNALGMAPVNVADVLTVTTSNHDRVRRLILTLMERLPDERSCSRGDGMRNAFLGG